LLGGAECPQIGQAFVVVVDYPTTITTTTTTTMIAAQLAKAAITHQRSEAKPR
jgi:hypothetical protein